MRGGAGRAGGTSLEIFRKVDSAGDARARRRQHRRAESGRARGPVVLCPVRGVRRLHCSPVHAAAAVALCCCCCCCRRRRRRVERGRRLARRRRGRCGRRLGLQLRRRRRGGRCRLLFLHSRLCGGVCGRLHERLRGRHGYGRGRRRVACLRRRLRLPPSPCRRLGRRLLRRSAFLSLPAAQHHHSPRARHTVRGGPRARTRRRVDHCHATKVHRRQRCSGRMCQRRQGGSQERRARKEPGEQTAPAPAAQRGPRGAGDTDVSCRRHTG